MRLPWEVGWWIKNGWGEATGWRLCVVFFQCYDTDGWVRGMSNSPWPKPMLFISEGSLRLTDVTNLTYWSQKGTNASSLRSRVVNKEWMRWGHWLTSVHCVLSVLWHCWLGERNVKQSVTKAYAIYLRRFSSKQVEDEQQGKTANTGSAGKHSCMYYRERK